MLLSDFEIFKFSKNQYTEFENNGHIYLLNKEPYLDIVLTDYCNADCNFCIADLIHKKLKANLEIFKKKITFALKYMNVKEILLLGGEPTVSPILLPLIKWLTQQHLDKIVITTNGIRLATDKKFCEQLFSSGITNINISFMNINPDLQSDVTNAGYTITVKDLIVIYETAKKYNVKLRINNNIFLHNNDNIYDIMIFYSSIKNYCDSVKFSPLLPVDDFSVVNYKTIWAKQHILENDVIFHLFTNIQDFYSKHYNVNIIENNLQFGFVKNTMIPLKTPIILNWNFGEFTGMMSKVVNENKINNIKLLANNELSLSWNRELTQYFIKTF